MTKALAKTSAPQVPAHLRDAPAEGLDNLGQYAQTPRVKIIQSQSMKDATRELQDEFGIGAVVIMPERVLVARAEEPIHVVPAFWWPSWARWPDLKDASGEAMIETMDPASEIAKRAKNPQLREEPYPNASDLKYKYVENLNFACEIQDGEAAGAVAVFAFNRGSHAVGRSICSYLKRRGVAIYGNVLRFECKITSNAAGQQYHRIEYHAAAAPFAPKETVDRLQPVHADMKRAYESQILGVAAAE